MTPRLTLLAGLALAALVPGSAGATFPGGNGRLVVSVESCPEYRNLAVTPFRGGALEPITPFCVTNDEGDTIDVGEPDASPDGQHVLAVQSYIKPGLIRVAVDEGTTDRVELPTGIRLAYQPSFAPDGKRFAFLSGRGAVWIGTLDNSHSRRLSQDCDGGCVSWDQPRWSPDGKHMAVELANWGGVPRRKSVKSGLWIVRVSDGKRLRRVSRTAITWDWSPDGKRLVYSTDVWAGENSQASGGNLYIVDRSGKNLRLLLHRENVAESDPVWSPDGKWVAWVSYRFRQTSDVGFEVKPSLWRIRSRGGKPIKIRNLPEPFEDGGLYNESELTWLPR